MPKTQSSIREIPISKKLLDLLKVLRQNSKSDYVIVSHNGKQIQPRAYQKSCDNLLKKLHIKHYGFHVLRHTFATRLLENGVDIKTISELLGHSSPTITITTYNSVDKSYFQKATDVLNSTFKTSKNKETEEMQDDELDAELERLLKEKQERRRRKQHDFEM